MKPLRDLPNREGFRFVGIDLDGNRHDCIVVKDAIGCHTVHRVSDNEPFFFKLYAWRKSISSGSAEREKAMTRELSDAVKLAREFLASPDLRAQVKVNLCAAGFPSVADMIDEAVIVSRELLRLTGEVE